MGTDILNLHINTILLMFEKDTTLVIEGFLGTLGTNYLRYLEKCDVLRCPTLRPLRSSKE